MKFVFILSFLIIDSDERLKFLVVGTPQKAQVIISFLTIQLLQIQCLQSS